MRFYVRCIGAIPITIGMVLATRPAATAGGVQDVQACLNSHEQGINLKGDGKLRLARREFEECAHDGCPDVVRLDCIDQLAVLGRSQPTIVVGATDATGHELREVSVLVDGEVAATALDGRPIELDPGERVIRCETALGGVATETIVVRQGEKDRLVTVHFREQAKSPPPASAALSPPARQDEAPGRAERSGPPVAFYALGALGLVGLGGFASFGISGLRRERDLEPCDPHCSQHDVDAVKSRYLLADVSLGVGTVALGAATWILLANTSSEEPRATTTAEIGVTRGGLVLGVAGPF